MFAEVGYKSSFRQEDVQETNKFGLVGGVTEQGLEARIGERVHIHRH